MRSSSIGLLLLMAATALGCPKAPKVTVATQQPVDDRNTNYKPGAGAIVNSARAGKRVAVLNDFDNLRKLIFSYELENNRMPTKDDLRAELKGDGQNIQNLIDEGAIILPMPMTKGGLWAYEVDAEKAGGIVIDAGNVGRKSADEVKALLGQK